LISQVLPLASDGFMYQFSFYYYVLSLASNPDPSTCTFAVTFEDQTLFEISDISSSQVDNNYEPFVTSFTSSVNYDGPDANLLSFTLTCGAQDGDSSENYGVVILVDDIFVGSNIEVDCEPSNTAGR
jgi:hypothetical protein